MNNRERSDILIIVAIIQNVIQDMLNLLNDSQHDPLKKAAFVAMGVVMSRIYYSIKGEEWTDSPKELMNWMNNYCKDRVEALEEKPTLLEIQ